MSSSARTSRSSDGRVPEFVRQRLIDLSTPQSRGSRQIRITERTANILSRDAQRGTSHRPRLLARSMQPQMSAARKRMKAAQLEARAQNQQRMAAKLKAQAQEKQRRADDKIKAKLMKLWNKDDDAVKHIQQQEKSFNQTANALIRRVTDARKSGVKPLEIMEEYTDEIEHLYKLITPTNSESIILYDVYNALQENRYADVEDTQCLGGISVFDLERPVQTTAIDIDNGSDYPNFSPASIDIFRHFESGLQSKFGRNKPEHDKAKQFIDILKRQNQFRKQLSLLNEAAFQNNETKDQEIQLNTVSAATVGQAIKYIYDDIETFESYPGSNPLYVLIGTIYVRCQLTVEVDGESGNNTIKIELHETPGERNRFCVTMHANSKDLMYVDSLYYGVEERELYIGKRFSAKDLFKFVKLMGFKTLELDDASSLDFIARERQYVVNKRKKDESGVFQVFPKFVQRDDDKEADSFKEALSNTAEGALKNNFVEDETKISRLYLSMTHYNLFKHIVENREGSLRVYGSASAVGQEVEAAAGQVAEELDLITQFNVRSKGARTPKAPGNPTKKLITVALHKLPQHTCLKF